MPKDIIDKAVTVVDAKALFADWTSAPAIVLAVSGGPDSVALMWLAARWRAAMKKGPRLVVVTIDHGLRKEAAREARDVKKLATALSLEHRRLKWTGAKPKSGLPAAARDARYRLLVGAARKCGASHIFTAHTRDDQAETFIMRMSRGSGIAGLAAMAKQSPREEVVLARPLLDVSKVQLIATLKKAKIAFADDPTNRDTTFMRPRLRKLMPLLAIEGADARNLARLALRLARANAALDVMTDGAERYLASIDTPHTDAGFDLAAFSALSDEIRVRLLIRVIALVGYEGPAELGKVETLLHAMDVAVGEAKSATTARFRQTLAGAIISIGRNRIHIAAAPPRRGRSTA